jgi:plasmid stabilization system protein ParE
VIGYRLLPPAEEEMIEAALNYEEAHDRLGEAFLDDIQHAIDTVREHPKLGVEIGYGFRRALVRRFPFSVIYFIEGEEIVVIAVSHQSRSPEYWKGRM